jgi:uncharacterized membrane protein YphA (DoxX/SURF4 family)
VSKNQRKQRRRKTEGRALEPLPSSQIPGWRQVLERFTAPQPIVRLEALRILVPLFILGFMSSRLVHADHWIGDAGFRVPDMGGDWRQPLYLPPLPGWTAWALAAAMVASSLSLAAGFLTRYAAGLFAFTLAWVALADRLAAFTVSKLGVALVLALCLSPCGARYGVDSWLRKHQSNSAVFSPTHVSGLVVRFFQLTLVVMYCSSGICKARNDWLTTPYLLWTHLHGSYQTAFTQFLTNRLPGWSWNALQGVTLVFEVFAPLWFVLRWTRPFALAWGLAMHGMIGLMFGPVIWFSLLMASLLVACFAPLKWLEQTVGRLP